MNKVFVYTFYRFLEINDKIKLKKDIENFLSSKSIRGTILLADEGINGSVSSDKESLDELVLFIKNSVNIRKLEIKINSSDSIPFNRMKVRLKKEIVTLGKGDYNIEKLHGNKIHPKNWDKIIKDKNTTLIDVRNNFEIKIGKFKNAINPRDSGRKKAFISTRCGSAPSPSPKRWRTLSSSTTASSSLSRIATDRCVACCLMRPM